MSDSSERSPASRLRLAKGFRLPPLAADDLEIVEEALTTDHYMLAHITQPGERDRALRDATSSRRRNIYACGGFVIHTLRPLEKGSGTETIVAPPVGQTKREFLLGCLRSVGTLIPEDDDGLPDFDTITTKLARMGLYAAAGVHQTVHTRNAISFPSLVIPRFYMNEFSRSTDPELRLQFAIGLAASVFATLTEQRINEIDSQPGNDNPDAHHTPR